MLNYIPCINNSNPTSTTKQITLEDLQQLLSHLNPDMCREEWFKVLAGSKHEFGEAAYEVCKAWSSSNECAKYREKDFIATWKSIGKNDQISNPITIKTVLLMVKEAGGVLKEFVARPVLAKTNSFLKATGIPLPAAPTVVEKIYEILETSALATSDHPYCQAKKISPHGIKVLKQDLKLDSETLEFLEGDEDSSHTTFTAKSNSLITVAYNHNMIPQAIQFIAPNKPYNKCFLPGSRVRGHFGIVEGKTETVHFCEGFSTAATINETTGQLAIITFGKGNLTSAINSVLMLYPKNKYKFLIVADSDLGGLEAAKRASKLYKIPYTFPLVSSGKDFNDLFTKKGIQEVEKQLTENTVIDSQVASDKKLSNQDLKKSIDNADYPKLSQSDDAATVDNIIINAIKNYNKRKGNGQKQLERALNNSVIVGEGLSYTFTCDRKSGVVHHKISVKENNEKEEVQVESTKICGYLEVTAEIRGSDSRSWGIILKIYNRDDVCHVWCLPSKLLSGDGAEIRKELLHLGLKLKAGKRTNDYLLQYISEAAETLPLETCTTHTGWHGNCFVLPDQTIHANPTHPKVWHQSEFPIVNHYTQQGTLLEWQENVGKFCIGNSRLVLAVCVMFAAPLLRLLGGSSMGFHFVGKSSIGKTKILKVAASVCGSKKYVRQWRHTDNGLEGIAYFHNDSVLILDELSQAHAEDFYRILYMLANGSGKGRANCHGLPKEVFTWELLWLSSGETGLIGLLSESKRKVKVGQQIRQIDIQAQATEKHGVFEELHGISSSSTFADLLDENSSKYYGVVFIEWLKVLVKALEVKTIDTAELNITSLTLEEIKQLYKQNHAVLLKPYPDSKGQTVRVSSGFALLATAGEIATKAGITGWPEGAAYSAIEKIFKEYMTDKNSSSTQEEENILTSVKLFFETNWRSSFVFVDDSGGISEEKITYNTTGYYKKTKNGYIFFMSPQQYEKHLCVGFEKRMVTETMLKNGWLELAGDGKSTKLVRFAHLNDAPKRFYVFNGNKMLIADLDRNN